MKISILTVLFVMVILLFTFKSAGLPILLVLTIQGSIWINFTVPVLTHTNLYFLSYLVVSSIQMGATIDYAIVITNRYLDLKTQMDHRQAAVEALDQSFSTILTSGTIMSVAGFLIGGISTNATIGSVGLTLGRGTVTSIALVMTVLPQLLMLGDALIERTAITLNRDRKQRFNQGSMRLDGHIRGHVSGFVDGEFKGVLHGSVDALIESKYQQLDLPDTEKEEPHETVYTGGSADPDGRDAPLPGPPCLRGGRPRHRFQRQRVLRPGPKLYPGCLVPGGHRGAYRRFGPERL